MEIVVFWDVTLCYLVDSDQHFRGEHQDDFFILYILLIFKKPIKITLNTVMMLYFHGLFQRYKFVIKINYEFCVWNRNCDCYFIPLQ